MWIQYANAIPARNANAKPATIVFQRWRYHGLRSGGRTVTSLPTTDTYRLRETQIDEQTSHQASMQVRVAQHAPTPYASARARQINGDAARLALCPEVRSTKDPKGRRHGGCRRGSAFSIEPTRRPGNDRCAPALAGLLELHGCR